MNETEMMYAQQQFRSQSEYNMLKVRLDIEPVLQQLELFLRGSRQIVREENGIVKLEILRTGEPRANEVGVQEIISWASMVISPHTVQGNFPVDKHGYSMNYEWACKTFRERFGEDLVLNIYEWGIDEEQAMGIIDKVCFFVDIFLTRCIGDRERNSYTKTIEAKEVHTTGESSKNIGKLFK